MLRSPAIDVAYGSASVAIILLGLAFAILIGRFPGRRFPWWILMVGDSLVLGTVVHFAGGIDGPFAAVFILHSLLAGNTLGPRGGTYISLLDTLVLALSGFMTVNGIAPEGGSLLVKQLGLNTPTSLTVQYVMLRVALHGMLLLTVGLISGFLSELLRQQSGRLSDALEALRASRTGSRDILESLADGILVLDSDGVPLGANGTLHRMLGLGADWEAAVAKTQIYRLLRSMQDSGEIRGNIDLVVGDRVLECRMGTFRDASGEEPGVMAVLTDVTELRNLRSQLAEREKLAVVGRLSATMAHEIRNPLASISGAAQVIRSGGLSDLEVERMSGMIVSQSQRASDIIEGYLEIARGGRQREDCDLRLDDLLREVVEGARRSYAQHVTVEEAGMPAVVLRGKRQRLFQLFENILRNAAEALEGSNDGMVTITLGRVDNNIMVGICDNGPGMAPETLGHATEPFFTTREYGTGLGLYIARRVAEEHNGTLELRNRAEGGLEATVVLPAPAEGAA